MTTAGPASHDPTSQAMNLPPSGGDAPLPGARLALVLLLAINLFNYLDRYILSSNLTAVEYDLLPIRQTVGFDKKPTPLFIASTLGVVGSPVPGGPVASGPLVFITNLNPEQTGQGNYNKTRLGNLNLVFIIFYMIMAPLFGWLAERLPRWRLVGIGVILWSLASGASGLAGDPELVRLVGLAGLSGFILSYWFLFCTRCFVGIGEAAYGPAAPTMISDLYPLRRRGAVLAWFYAAIPVGSALGYSLGALVGWPDAFYWVVLPGMLLGVSCFCMPEPLRGQTDLGSTGTHHQARLRDYLTLLRTPSYVLTSLGMTALTFAMGGIAFWMPDYIVGFRGLAQQPFLGINLDPATLFGAILVVSGLSATLLGGMAGDWLRPRFSGAYFLVSGSSMLLAFPMFLLGLYTPFPLAWLFMFLTCFCLFFNTGPTNTILANVTHPAIRAQGFAVNILIIHLFGDAVSPTVIGFVADTFASGGKPDLNAGFLTVTAMILIGALLWLAGVPFLGRDTERAPHRLSENDQVTR
jgi:MFS family permease